MRGRVAIFAPAGAAFAIALALAILGTGEEDGALSNWQALVLGLVQGGTELLPISSSGHLILVPWAADWDYLKRHDEFNQTFDVALHLGTLVAVAAYFGRDLVRLFSAWISSAKQRAIYDADERIAWLIVVAAAPAALAGVVADEFVVEHLGEPWQIAILLAVFGGVLWLADRREFTHTLAEMRLGTAIAVGLAQALALAPGVSRSGITITAARWFGLDRDSAARFSFLLLVPTTLGAVVWKGITDVLLGDLPAGWEGPFVVGMLAAAASGFVAIVALLGYVRRHTYAPFVVYRIVVAVLVIAVIASGVRDASF